MHKNSQADNCFEEKYYPSPTTFYCPNHKKFAFYYSTKNITTTELIDVFQVLQFKSTASF